MTPIYDKPIDRKIAWVGSDFTSKAEISIDLNAVQVSALEDILLRIRNKPFEEITLEDCHHPSLDAVLDAAFDEVQHGRGFVFVRGIPVLQHSIEDIEKIFWAVGTHFGKGASQTSLGARVVPIQEERLKGGAQATRGTKSRQELAMHTDLAEINALLCVRPALSGGESQIVSALAIHNEILKTRPDVLPILYRGWPYHLRNEQQDGHPGITPFDVPVFCNVDGNVSSSLVFGNIAAALHVQGRKLSDEENDALAVIETVSDKLKYEYRYEAGDATFANDFTTWHSRSEFVDPEVPGTGRLMLRMWLDAKRDQRSVIPEMYTFNNASGRSGIDYVPGRADILDRNEYYGIPEDVLEAIKAAQKKNARLVA